MLSLKYAKEYRLDTFTDESGKVKDCTVYIGPLYEWTIPEAAVSRLRKRFSIITLVQVVLFISSLWQYGDLSRLWWVIVPYCCLLFVFLYFGAACYNLFTLKGQFHREKKDKTVERIKGCSIMGILLTAISFLAATISLFIQLVQFRGWDLWMLIVEAIMIVSFCYERKLSEELQVRELVNPDAQVWKDK